MIRLVGNFNEKPKVGDVFVSCLRGYELREFTVDKVNDKSINLTRADGLKFNVALKDQPTINYFRKSRSGGNGARRG